MYKVLIIDDEPWSREVVKALGEWDRLKLDVVGEAEDGREGLRQIEALAPHIVITDMRMPGIEGVELLRQMGESYPALKIIVMSGYEDFVYLKQAIRSRAVEYLLKPVDPAELNAALAQCTREFAEAAAERKSEWRIQPALIEGPLLERYTQERQRVYASLLELDAAGVRASLQRLAEFMGLPDASPEVSGISARIAYDFSLMLETFVSENGIPFTPLHDGDGRHAGSSVAEMAAEVAQQFADAIEAVLAERKGRYRLDLEDVKRHIDLHYTETLSLDALAQRFFVSKEHLSRAFKAHTGENVSDYIARQRMEMARMLISERKLSIKHAAQLAGYEDLAYFYRVFKKVFGVAPGAIRDEP